MAVHMHHQVAFWKLVNLSCQLESCIHNMRDRDDDEKAIINLIGMRCLDSETNAFTVSEEITFWQRIYDKMTYYFHLSKSNIEPFDHKANFEYLQSLFTSATSAQYEHLSINQDSRLYRYFNGSLSKALELLSERIQSIFSALPIETRVQLDATKRIIQEIGNALLATIRKEEKGQIANKIEEEFVPTLQMLLKKASDFSDFDDDVVGQLTLKNLQLVVTITDGWVQQKYRDALHKEFKQAYESSLPASLIKGIREKIILKLVEIEKKQKARLVEAECQEELQEINKSIRKYKKGWEKTKSSKDVVIEYMSLLEKGDTLGKQLHRTIKAIAKKYKNKELSEQEYSGSSVALVMHHKQQILQNTVMDIITHSTENGILLSPTQQFHKIFNTKLITYNPSPREPISQELGAGRGQLQIGTIGKRATVNIHQTMTTTHPLGTQQLGIHQLESNQASLGRAFGSIGSLFSMAAPIIPGSTMITRAMQIHRYFHTTIPYLPWTAVQIANIWYSTGLSFTNALAVGIALTATAPILSATIVRYFPENWRSGLKPIFDVGAQILVANYAPQCIAFLKSREFQILPEKPVLVEPLANKVETTVTELNTKITKTAEESDKGFMEIFHEMVDKKIIKSEIAQKVMSAVNGSVGYVVVATAGKNGVEPRHLVNNIK